MLPVAIQIVDNFHVVEKPSAMARVLTSAELQVKDSAAGRRTPTRSAAERRCSEPPTSSANASDCTTPV